MKTEIRFENKNNEILKGKVISLKENSEIGIILCHGFPGSQKSKGIQELVESLSKNFFVMTFDFSGCGISEGHFENLTLSKEVSDLLSATKYFKENYSLKKLILLGRSTGAVIVTLSAYRIEKYIDGIILISGVGDLRGAENYDFSKKQLKEFKELGFSNIKCGWDGEEHRINHSFINEFYELTPLEDLKKYNKSILIIHGSKDEFIPFEKDSYELFNAANNKKELFIIEGADHRYSEKEHYDKMLIKIFDFIRDLKDE